MDFKKIYKQGLGVSFLLLMIIIGVLFIPNLNKKQLSDGNSLFTSGPDDAYEPNNNPTMAFNLTMWEDFWLYDINGSGILEDDDWYEIYINPGFEELQISLTFNHSLGNIDIDLLNSTGSTPITSSHGVSDNEFIEFMVPSAGIYFIRLFGPNASNTYDLWWKTFPTDDIFEPNNGFSTAYDLIPYQNVWLSSIFGPGIPGPAMQFDEDWYKIYVNPGREFLHVTLLFSHAMGDIDIELYDINSVILTSSTGTMDNEFIDFIVPSSGEYYLRIYYANNGNLYDLLWNTTMPIPDMGDDWMEENDDFWSASYVDPGYYSGLKMVYNDNDWYHTYLESGDVIDVAIFFKHMEGDLELELYDPSEGQRFGSYSSNDDEFITYTADMEGDWRIRVFHADGLTELRYDLDLWVNAGSSTDDDWMEENDAFGSAWYVDPNYYSGLILDHSDEDWFKIYLTSGDVIDIWIYFDDNQGNLELELHSPSNTFRSGSYSEDYAEFILFVIDVSGEWRIRVYHADEDSKVYYDLDIRIKDDFYEFNNHPDVLYKEHPSNLAEDERIWLSDLHGLAVQEDHDWYMIDITPGFERLVLDLSFNHTLGNIDIVIYDELSIPIIGNSSMTDNEHIDYILPHSGLFAIHVYGDNMRNTYDMRWDDVRTDWRSDDNYEMNNDAMSAFDISFLENNSIWILDGLALQYDQDWYEIYIDDPNLQLTVVLMYDYAEGPIGFEVRDSDNKKITGNFTETDNDYIIHDVSNGTYYIRVFGDNSGNVYNLWWGTQKIEDVGMIPGYDILILIGSIIGISTVVIKKRRSKFKQK